MSVSKLNPLVSTICEKINLIERYGDLHQKFSNSKSAISKIDKKEVLKILKPYGYPYKYSEGRYYFEEPYNEDISFLASISPKGGSVMMYMNVKKDGEFLDLDSGGLHSIYRKKLGNELGSPIFYTTYEELAVIVKEFFAIYEDFKKVVIEMFVV